MKADKTVLTIVGFGLSALLLTIIQHPFKCSFLAWIAYVPLIIAAIRYGNKKALYLFSWLVAFVYWLGNIYWIGYVTVPGWIAFCAYTALLWPVLIAVVRFLHSKKVPLILTCAVVIVGTERLQGLFLGGFYWRHLSHSQYQFKTLIQITDIFGAAGISFLIAMVNGFLAELFLKIKSHPPYSLRSFSGCHPLWFVQGVVIVSLFTIVLFYGDWRISQAEETIEQGPLVGVVQSNLPQEVKMTESFEESKKYFHQHLSLSKKCADANALVITWPETIVASIMDKGAWPFLLESEEAIYFHKYLCDHAKEGLYILVGAPGGYIEYLQGDDLLFEKFNSAFLYTPYGDQAGDNYDKIHLVPFGEYIPFKNSLPWLYEFLMSFSPYDFDYTLTPGKNYTVFNITDDKMNINYRFGVMICYESTIPPIVREFAIDDEGRKKTDWLVNISNDGWFVRYKDEKVTASTELPQHAIASIFRAVENRISIVRSVNTGISCLIDPLGNIRSGFVEGDLPEKAFDRKGVDGYFVDKVLIDSRVTFFSRYGQWLDNSCGIIVFSILILLAIKPFVRNKSRKAISDDKNDEKKAS